MSKDNLKVLLTQCIKEALDAPSLKDALQNTANAIIMYYPNTKIWFAQSFGKRWSYIAGAGEETYIKPEQVVYLKDYSVFLQNFKDISKDEESILIDLFRLITVIKQD